MKLGQGGLKSENDFYFEALRIGPSLWQPGEPVSYTVEGGEFQIQKRKGDGD